MPKLYQRNQAWYIDTGASAAGGRVSLGRITEAEAQEALRALAHGGEGPGVDFQSWAGEYAEWHSAEFPDSYYRVEQVLRQHLIPFFGAYNIGAIARHDVERYKRLRVDAGAAPGTVAKELRTLQAALNKAVEWDRLATNKARGVKPPRDTTSKPPRWYTAGELAQIYAVDSLHAPTWRLLVNTGMRRGEAMQLQWRDVSDEAIKVISEPGARTKSSKWRLVPVSPGARIALSALRAPTPYVLPRMDLPSLSRAFARSLARAQLDGSLHCLRHTYCSHLVMHGVDLRTIQVLAGHSTTRMTERYAHLAPEHLTAAGARLAL